MTVPARIGGFLLVLAAVLAMAVGVGRAVGPLDPAAAEGHHDGASRAASAQEPTGKGGGRGADMTPAGLVSSQSGYSLRLTSDTAGAGHQVPLAFHVEGPDGRPVTAYDVRHDKELHLIAVRRDQSGFQHVHPTRSGDGTWRSELDLTPGTWRLLADFKATGGPELTLGADLDVRGRFEPQPERAVSTTAAVDGYAVTLDGELVPDTESQLTLTVTKGGAPVTDLQPYLGSLGHLVALRTDDLAYLHVHPHDAVDAGPTITFSAAVPSAGRYALYLDFRHDGEVRTAALAMDAETTGADPDRQPQQEPGGHEH